TVNEDQVNGSILDGRLALTWRMNPWLALGLGYAVRKFTDDMVYAMPRSLVAAATPLHTGSNEQ
ncbi:MAG TPA: hypothetical protein VFO35_03135, partial [Steroidobacteraceae bacterium]|nr:hypothetical protein [Steroidobacteraceae bacterium]